MCTRECICAWHVHRCVCMGAHTCVHVSGVERLPASLSPSFMPSSSHLTVLRGSRWRGGPGCPHPGTGLEGTLPWSPQNKSCRLLWPHSPGWDPRPLWPHWVLGVGSMPTQHQSLSSEFSLLDT